MSPGLAAVWQGGYAPCRHTRGLNGEGYLYNGSRLLALPVASWMAFAQASARLLDHTGLDAQGRTGFRIPGQI